MVQPLCQRSCDFAVPPARHGAVPRLSLTQQDWPRNCCLASTRAGRAAGTRTLSGEPTLGASIATGSKPKVDLVTEQGKAQRIELFRIDTAPMRAFHLTWVAFCAAFFSWFAVAPLMPVIREDLQLSPVDVSDSMLASVAATIVARIVVGTLCDRFGPRRVFTWLLVASAAPVAGIAFVQSPGAFILARFAIGIVGASFVVTQFHMTQMFAPAVLGTANAVTAGWGNLGGGLAQVAMPALLALAVAAGFSALQAWRVTMAVPACLLLLCAAAYWRWTTDTPSGNWVARKREGVGNRSARPWAGLVAAAADLRTWVLALAYGLCFGVELTIHNVAALYFVDRFGLGLQQAGFLAGIVGLANVFARAAGGAASDSLARWLGLHGRVYLLFAVLAVEGAALAAFAQSSNLGLAVVALVIFALFVNFSTGATYGVVPFLHPTAVGAVSGLVAAGGNLGAVVAAWLFRGATPLADNLLLLGSVVVLLSPLVLLVRFSPADQLSHSRALQPGFFRTRSLTSEAAQGHASV